MRNLSEKLKNLMLNENVDIKVIKAIKDLLASIEANDTFIEHSDTPDSYSGQAGKTVGVNGLEDGLEFVNNVSTDEKVGVRGTDTTPSYLNDKLLLGSNKLSKNINNPAGNEELEIDVVPANINHNDLGSIGASDHHTKTTSSEINLADLNEKDHASLTNVLTSQHHVRYTDAESRAAINDIFGSDGHADADIDMDSHRIRDALDPLLDQDYATKKYVDDEVSGIFYTVDDSELNIDIDFSASASEDVTIDISNEIRRVLRGRLYIDADPGAGFVEWATVSFYAESAKHGENLIFRFRKKLVYTELDTATTGSDANIIPDDHTDFSIHELVMFLDDGELARLKTIASTMVAEDNVDSHAVNTGLVNVAEFHSRDLFNTEDGTNVYLRIAFSSAQTVSLKMKLLLAS